MSWVVALQLVLQLAAYFARRAERLDIEKSLLSTLENLHGKHVDEAADAHNRVTLDSLPNDRNPNQRD